MAKFAKDNAEGYIQIDAKDRRILSALRANGRLTIGDLSEQVGLSPSPCWTRVKRLEAAGVIDRYVAVINHSAIGLQSLAFIEVTLDKHDSNALESFETAIMAMPEVLDANLVTGDYDYLLKIVVRDTQHYEDFLRNRIYKISGLRHTRSSFNLRALKSSISVDPQEIEL